MENGTSIVVRVQLTSRDLLDLFRASRMKYLVWLLVVIGVFYLYLLLAEVVNEGFSGATSSTIFLYGFVAAFAFFTAYVAPRIRVRQALRHGPTLREPLQYSLSATGVDLSSELVTGTYRWGAFCKIAETRQSFVLFQSPFSAVIVPKRYLASPEQVAQLRELFRAHFMGKKKLAT